jgi:hypothetical protein
MPKYDLTEEERHALVEAARQKIREDRFPYAPRWATLKAALAKLDPGSVRISSDPPQPPTGPILGSRRKPGRQPSRQCSERWLLGIFGGRNLDDRRGQFCRPDTAVRCAAAALHVPFCKTRVAVKRIFGAMG